MVCFFFFSSRRRHTRFDCDWSSDVCSSDLLEEERALGARELDAPIQDRGERLVGGREARDGVHRLERSEERRVGKSVDLGGRRTIKKKKAKRRGSSEEIVVI